IAQSVAAPIGNNAPTPLAGVTVGAAAGVGGAFFNRVTFPAGTDLSQLAVGMTVSDSASNPNAGDGVLNPYQPVTITGIEGNALYLSFQPTSGFATGANDTLTFTNQNRTLTLTGSSTAANSFAPALVDSTAGTLALSKTGSGTWIISGSNTYTGGTT